VESLKRVAGVEPPLRSSLSGAPPAHDRWTAYVVDTPAEAFYRHFRRCFTCHFGDRYTNDHFCEIGRELCIAILDDIHDRIEWS
jgi:hypothetical protein